MEKFLFFCFGQPIPVHSLSIQFSNDRRIFYFLVRHTYADGSFSSYEDIVFVVNSLDEIM